MMLQGWWKFIFYVNLLLIISISLYIYIHNSGSDTLATVYSISMFVIFPISGINGKVLQKSNIDRRRVGHKMRMIGRSRLNGR